MFQRAHERLRAARSGEKGFTLIELLIVIVILGVLAGIVVFSVQFITDRGNKAACQTNLKDVQSAVEAFYAKQNPPTYPADIAALKAAGVLKDDPTPGTWSIDSNGVVSVSFGPGKDGCNFA